MCARWRPCLGLNLDSNDIKHKAELVPALSAGPCGLPGTQGSSSGVFLRWTSSLAMRWVSEDILWTIVSLHLHGHDPKAKTRTTPPFPTFPMHSKRESPIWEAATHGRLRPTGPGMPSQHTLIRKLREHSWSAFSTWPQLAPRLAWHPEASPPARAEAHVNREPLPTPNMPQAPMPDTTG